jgi:hypothetical protein
MKGTQKDLPIRVEFHKVPNKKQVQQFVVFNAEGLAFGGCQVTYEFKPTLPKITVQVFVNGEQPYDEHTEYVDEQGIVHVVPGVRDGMMPLADHQPTLQEVLDSFGSTSFPLFINDEGNGANKTSLRIIRIDALEEAGGWKVTAVQEIRRTALTDPAGNPLSMIRFELDGAQLIAFQVGEHLDMSRIIWVPLAKFGQKVDLTCVRYQGGVWACGLDPFSDQPDNDAGINDRGLDAAQTLTYAYARLGFVVHNNSLKAQLAREGDVNLWSINGYGPWAEQMLLTLYNQVIYYDDKTDIPNWVTINADGYSFTDHRSPDAWDSLKQLPAPPTPGLPGYGNPWNWQPPQVVNN